MSEIPDGSVWKREDGSRAVLLALYSYTTGYGTLATHFVVLDHHELGRVGKRCNLASDYVLRNYDRLDE